MRKELQKEIIEEEVRVLEAVHALGYFATGICLSSNGFTVTAQIDANDFLCEKYQKLNSLNAITCAV
jgi:hypothetical protein